MGWLFWMHLPVPTLCRVLRNERPFGILILSVYCGFVRASTAYCDASTELARTRLESFERSSKKRNITVRRESSVFGFAIRQFNLHVVPRLTDDRDCLMGL